MQDKSRAPHTEHRYGSSGYITSVTTHREARVAAKLAQCVNPWSAITGERWGTVFCNAEQPRTSTNAKGQPEQPVQPEQPEQPESNQSNQSNKSNKSYKNNGLSITNVTTITTITTITSKTTKIGKLANITKNNEHNHKARASFLGLVRWDRMTGLNLRLGFTRSQYSRASMFTLRWSMPSWQMSACNVHRTR